MQSGTLVRRITEIHNQYGTIVRVAPNELSFIDAAACRDIYAARAGQPRFPKNPVWMGEPIPRGNSIVDANEEDHARMRKVWGHAFTEKALRAQEPVLQMYVSRFIARLREVVEEEASGGPLDIVQWFNFLTFDLTGDLAFGESFGCLEGRTLHPWISVIFAHFKSATLLASIRFYPSLYRVLIWSLPASVLRKQREHFQMASQKVQQRLNLDTERTDFLQHVVEYDGVGDRDGTLSAEEIEKTAATMIVAGSETTGTLLSGILNCLLKHPDAMEQLVKEVRSAFSSEHATPSLASLAELPYLGAVIQEGLRVTPPVPTGMPRVVPRGGAYVNGHWFPENVGQLAGRIINPFCIMVADVQPFSVHQTRTCCTHSFLLSYHHYHLYSLPPSVSASIIATL